MGRVNLIILLVVITLSLTACSSPEKMMLEAANLSGPAKYDEAIKIYNKIIDKFPSHGEAYLELAKIYRHRGPRELEEPTLINGVNQAEDKLPLQLALADLYNRRLKYDEAEILLKGVLEANEQSLLAYETLLRFYEDRRAHEKIIDLYEQYKDTIPSDLATILAAASYLDEGEDAIANDLLSSMDIDRIKSGELLERLTDCYIEMENKAMATIVAEKGLDSDKPHIFRGILYGLTNEKGFHLVRMRNADINGDGEIENILLMRSKDPDAIDQDLELIIQDGETGNLMETISLGQGGYTANLYVRDMNHDGIADIFVNTTKGRDDKELVQYGYSYKNNKLVDIFDGFAYDIDFVFLDGYKAEVFSPSIRESYSIELNNQQKESYKGKYYDSNGTLLTSNIGELKVFRINNTYIDQLVENGLLYYAELIGPDSNIDVLATVETTYKFEDGKWVIHSFDVAHEENKITSVPYNEDKIKTAAAKAKEMEERNIIDDDIEFLKEIFSLNRPNVINRYGNLTYHEELGVEYVNHEGMMINVSYGEVSSIIFVEGSKIFGINIESYYNPIIEALGHPKWEDYDETDGMYTLYYEIDKFALFFKSVSKDGRFNLLVNLRPQ